MERPAAALLHGHRWLHPPEAFAAGGAFEAAEVFRHAFAACHGLCAQYDGSKGDLDVLGAGRAGDLGLQAKPNGRKALKEAQTSILFTYRSKSNRRIM